MSFVLNSGLTSLRSISTASKVSSSLRTSVDLFPRFAAWIKFSVREMICFTVLSPVCFNPDPAATPSLGVAGVAGGAVLGWVLGGNPYFSIRFN